MLLIWNPKFQNLDLIFFFVFVEFLQVLMFDSVNRRTCLHYAAYYGHADCVQAILSAAQSSPVAVHWLLTTHSLSLCLLMCFRTSSLLRSVFFQGICAVCEY